MEDRDFVRAVNGELPPPGSGALSISRWANVFGVTTDSVRRLFREKKVPRKRIGEEFYARPEDVWSAFPWTDGSDG